MAILPESAGGYCAGEQFTVESPRGIAVYLRVRRPVIMPGETHMGNVGLTGLPKTNRKSVPSVFSAVLRVWQGLDVIKDVVIGLVNAGLLIIKQPICLTIGADADIAAPPGWEDFEKRSESSNLQDRRNVLPTMRFTVVAEHVRMESFA